MKLKDKRGVGELNSLALYVASAVSLFGYLGVSVKRIFDGGNLAPAITGLLISVFVFYVVLTREIIRSRSR